MPRVAARSRHSRRTCCGTSTASAGGRAMVRQGMPMQLLRYFGPPVSGRSCMPTFRPCGLCTPRHHRDLGRRECYAWAQSPEWSQLAAAPAAARCRDAAARLCRGQRHRPSALAAPPPPKQAPPSSRDYKRTRTLVCARGGCAAHRCMLQPITRLASSAVSSAVFAALSASACPRTALRVPSRLSSARQGAQLKFTRSTIIWV